MKYQSLNPLVVERYYLNSLWKSSSKINPMIDLYLRSLNNVILATQDSVYFTSDSHVNCLARFLLGVHVGSYYFEKVADVFRSVLWGFRSRLVSSVFLTVFHFMDPIMLSETVNQSHDQFMLHSKGLNCCYNLPDSMSDFGPINWSIHYCEEKVVFNYPLLVP